MGLMALLPAKAQEKTVPESKVQVQLSYAPVVRQVSPAVVNVYGTRVEKTRPMPMDDFFRRFFGDRGPGMPQERVQRSLGSGVIVDANGLVVTNNHVIEGMTTVKVALADRREFDAEIILRDPRADLAILRLKDAKNLHAIELGDSENLEVGDLVLAIGNPFGVGQTVTQGIVSALARTQVGVSDYQFFIQTDAAINPGNSGGGLINMKGELVGINTAIYSRSGGSIGIGFAIPTSMVKAVVQTAKNGGKAVVRPWFGAKLQAVSAEMAEAIGLDRPMGALIVNLNPGGPAEKAGLKRGDVILAVDGHNIDDMEAFGYRFALKGTGGDIKLTLQRGKDQLEKSVKLLPPPEIPARDTINITGRSPFQGATVANLSPAVADELDMDTSAVGVVVLETDDNSTANRVGFQKGDIIVAINRTPMKTTQDLKQATSQEARLWEIVVNRNGREFVTVLR
ncbi:DegQ family serine endoprotease [Microvirga sp. W0021]|uniref:DegQ family serine endoprotease n=2 Tax=Hohaiivirga grylli TaxID=3133970 RepID=A0ABV0BJ27_9HYPH